MQNFLKRLVRGIFVTSIALCIFFFFVLPQISNLWLLPKLEKRLPFKTSVLRLQQLSPYHLSGSLYCAQDHFVINLPEVRADYTPQSLCKQELESVVINRLLLQLPFEDGKVIMPKIPVTKKKQQDNNLLPLLLPFAAKRVYIKEGELLLKNSKQPEKNISLSFSATIIPELSRQQEKGRKFYLKKCRIDLTLEGDITADITVNLDISRQEQPTIDFAAVLYSVAQLSQFLSEPLQLNGSAVINADIALTHNFAVKNYNAAVKFNDCVVKNSTFTARASAAHFPIKAVINGDDKQVHLKLDNLSLIKPEEIHANISARMNLIEQSFLARGELRTLYSSHPLNLQAEGLFGKNKRVDFSLTGKSLTFATASLHFPSLHGVVKEKFYDKTVIKEGQLDFGLKRLVGKDSEGGEQYHLDQLHLTLPFRFPLSKKVGQNKRKNKNKEGKISIGQICWEKNIMGRLIGTVNQNDQGFSANLILQSPLLQQFNLNCKGTLQTPFFATDSVTEFATYWQCRLPWAVLDSTVFPAKVIKIPEGLEFTAKLGGKAKLAFVDRKFSGKLNISVSDGELKHGENHISGIHTALLFPDITRLQSAPDQRLAIEKIEAGKIFAQNAKIRWRMENSSSLFIESILMEWCGGRVESSSLRLSPKTKEITTTLYCDRLLLSEVLKQFGIGNASGKVSLNGRLPLFLTQNRIEIQDGFLYTTPGDTGIINFNNTKTLVNAIGGKSTPYIAYSLESLKEFSYNWIKLLFNSKEDDLLVQLQLDGKPAKPLPYVYEMGKIVPATEERVGKGLQHPVHFDVNFHIPLQQFYHYGTGYQSLMKSLEEKF